MKLAEKSEKSKLFNQVLRLISHRPRSQKEIEFYLQRRKAKSALVTEIISQLKKINLLDDKQFVLWWLEQRSTFRPKGKRALQFELWQKGVSPEIIASVLANFDEISLAKKALKNRPGTAEEKAAFLQRRGFSWETIRLIIRTK